MAGNSVAQVHICMASAQPLPNLIPLLDEDQRPQKVVLLVSEGMQEKAAVLRKNIENLGCQVEFAAIHPYRIDEVRSRVLDMLARYEGRKVALNATGGTKIMILGAYEIFREMAYPVFYIDTDNNQRIELLPQPVTYPLPDLLTVRLALAAYGYEVAAKGELQVAPKYRQLGDFLTGNVDRLSSAIGVLNGCAGSAKKQLQARLQPQDAANPAVVEVLEKFRDAGALDRLDDRLVFADEQARYLCNGGWLESYVLAQVNGLKGEKLVRDHGCNVVFVSCGGVKNEIDIAFAAKNRLYLIECKTAVMMEKADREGRADNAAYKLEVLRDLVGGVYAKAMLVSYRRLKAEDRQRCLEYGIKVVEGKEIVRLTEILRKWIV